MLCTSLAKSVAIEFTRHAKDRLSERMGEHPSKARLEAIGGAISRKRYEVLNQKGSDLEIMVRALDKQYRLVYNVRDQVVVTVLPLEGQTTWR